MGNTNINWMNEKIETFPNNPKLYKLLCFLFFRRKRKFTYRDWYIVMSIYNKQTPEGNKLALEKILRLYKFNNNKLPDNVKEYVEQ